MSMQPAASLVEEKATEEYFHTVPLSQRQGISMTDLFGHSLRECTNPSSPFSPTVATNIVTPSVPWTPSPQRDLQKDVKRSATIIRSCESNDESPVRGQTQGFKNRRPPTPGYGLRASSKYMNVASNITSVHEVRSHYPSKSPLPPKTATTKHASSNSSPFAVYVDKHDTKFSTPSPKGRSTKKPRTSTGKSKKKRLYSEADKENVSPNSTPKGVHGKADKKRLRTMT
ncbi:hypothetical protein H257_05936 [Aphanomyces astaci]|uniref:Uncharacterized protein n=1 Tax=Aphanomyces astaci TaxID=112090 RepID=W4GQV9_APHAT|nr:hypothetical protein H257_05936 [Aphanomyces astaci]ETV81404.1 hypothetical protein H257_05936 [Aphanomyces astaci]|eukprot:XP_009829262.1 hypothetical protein H257_05936 [Aphanomyces astaci]